MCCLAVRWYKMLVLISKCLDFKVLFTFHQEIAVENLNYTVNKN